MSQSLTKKKSARKPSCGHLIVFEGPDGVGKSTIAAGVAEALSRAGARSRVLSFPGKDEGTLGKLVYGLHHDLGAYGIKNLSPTARQALHVAAHLDIMERVILPALNSGEHIILDRYWWSTLVYGQASGIPAEVLNDLIHPERRLWADQPTLIFLVDRDHPINRDEEPAYWSKLRKLYAALEIKERRKCKVVRLPNVGDVNDATGRALSALAERGIAKGQSKRKKVQEQHGADEQFSIEFNARPAPAAACSLVIHSRIAPAKPTIVLDSYWRFAAERQDVFFRRLLGAKRPWTADPIIDANKFTNAYRASDRVSQYLIRHVIYRADLPATPVETCFRILLFKLFNKIETWQLLEESFGSITYEDYNYPRYDQILSKALERGQRIYSAAYIMPPGGTAFGQTAKHQNHLRLLEMMMRDELPK
jgi:thymidylate kinase